jgi:hypothetical protein
MKAEFLEGNEFGIETSPARLPFRHFLNMMHKILAELKIKRFENRETSRKIR